MSEIRQVPPSELLRKRIKDIRRARGLSQEQVGKQIGGMDDSTFGALENGKRKITFDEAVAVCAVLDIPFTDVVFSASAPAVETDLDYAAALDQLQRAEALVFAAASDYCAQYLAHSRAGARIRREGANAEIPD